MAGFTVNFLQATAYRPDADTHFNFAYSVTRLYHLLLEIY